MTLATGLRPEQVMATALGQRGKMLYGVPDAEHYGVFAEHYGVFSAVVQAAADIAIAREHQRVKE